MKNLIFISFMTLFLLFISLTSSAQKRNIAIQEVESILLNQEKQWNNGDIDAFMEDYWKSDELQFIGSSGITYGWQKTKDNYFRRYPDRATMGHLTFTIIKTDQLSINAMMMTGKFHLKRDMGDAQGHFLLVWRKIKGQWLIIADHTS